MFTFVGIVVLYFVIPLIAYPSLFNYQPPPPKPLSEAERQRRMKRAAEEFEAFRAAERLKASEAYRAEMFKARQALNVSISKASKASKV